MELGDHFSLPSKQTNIGENIRVFPKYFSEFSEFSDKNNIIIKKLIYLNLLSPVLETAILPLCHRDTANRKGS